MGYVIEAIEKHIAPFLSGLWDSLMFWRSLGLLTLLVLTAGVYYRSRIREWIMRAEWVEHDRDIFRRTDTILSEQQLMNFLDGLQRNDFFCFDERQALSEAQYFFDLEGNQYLFAALRRKSARYVRAIDTLSGFLAHESTVDRVLPSGKMMSVVHGHVNNSSPTDADFEEAKDRACSEMARLAHGVANEYQLYRRAVKRLLQI